MDTQYIDGFIGELLHINEVAENKLIDLGANGGAGTYILSHACPSLSAYALNIISARMGKTANTILLNSAISGGEQRVNRSVNAFGWSSLSGLTDPKSLHAFISSARKDLIARGANPLFLGVGALKWRVTVKERGKEILKDVTSPYLIFPVKLVVSGNTSPVAIDFIDDDVYINPCLMAKLNRVLGKEIAEGFPLLGASLDEPVNLQLLGDGQEYLNKVCAYVQECNSLGGGDTLFEFDKDLVAISQYKHDELCTYYDIRRNKQKIYAHPQVKRLFAPSRPKECEGKGSSLPLCVLPRDSVQEKIIKRVTDGQSLIIKGPPGTGKTVTIANMIAALMAQNKRVLFASKKISALTEVYAKLPDKLRKFAMLLDCESEAGAAKLRPDEIKQDFKRLLAERKSYQEPAQLSADISQAKREKANAMKGLSAYIELMYKEECIAGGSFYAALDTVCKNDLPVIEFCKPAQAAAITREQYNALYGLAGEAQTHFAYLTANGAHPAYKCPWFGIDLSCDTEKALLACSSIEEAFKGVDLGISEGLSQFGLNVGGFTLGEIYGVSENLLTKEHMRALADWKGAKEVCAELEQKYSAYIQTQSAGNLHAVCEDIKTLEQRAVKLEALNVDGKLTCGDISLIADNKKVFYITEEQFLSRDALGALVKLFDNIREQNSQKQRAILRAEEVFKRELEADDVNLIKEACKELQSYFDGKMQKPKAFDFKAKKLYAKLCALSYLTKPTFIEVVGAVQNYAQAFKTEEQTAATCESVYKIFRRKISDGEMNCVRLVLNACSGAHADICAYVNAVCGCKNIIEECAADIVGGDINGLKTEDIIACYRREFRLALLKQTLATACEAIGAQADGQNAVGLARDILGAHKFLSACAAQNKKADGVQAAEFLQGVKGLKVGISSILAALSAFGAAFFKNYYVINGEDNTFADMRILSSEAGNRNVIAAAAKYTKLKTDPDNALDLSAFLYWFEKGGTLPDGATFMDEFEHSFYALAVRAVDESLGIMRNGLGAYVEENLKRLSAAEQKLSDYNCGLIESKCFSRIDANDPDYVFVQDRNPNENLRLTFKRHGKAILKLQRCFIMSPYTASLLFGGGEFEDFDVLIIDEASQMEPALALPVLFRCKQCVIVGDEWQMPPIKHFVALDPAREEGDGEGYSALEQEISVLGLALRCGGFRVEELLCHYRSKTESLIKYSQEAFYPNMRTFPAPVPAITPAKGVAGLGLKDVYVPSGCVCAGKNTAEAQKVVEELNLHFDNYYDEKTKKLAMSVGVVAFGEAQCEEIEARVKADKKLYAKMCAALENFNDLPEKLIFFKTIETVQGQECGHLILSITHGKREGGLYMHFGQLNQGKLGRCIFNVAVTRAQYMVTVVHSVRAAEISGENVSYIGDYLQTVERFKDLGRGQFLSEEEERGFLKSVADFIISKGIEPERVVFNYGVTEGSVRIPIAVLSKDLQRAELGVWCEKPVGKKYDYLDYNMRYRQSLISCGWQLHPLSVHDWLDNAENEKQSLAKALNKIINR